jgi:RNA polymerase sigma factor (sigma-70 family)
LFERYHQPLYRYCRSILRHDSDAQDALQSTFAGALVALRRGQRDAPLRPWLYRIAHNEAISLIRRRHGAGEELLEGMEPRVMSSEERAGERARLALLVTDLHQLGERQRGALVMRELSGLSHEEIALALGTSAGTAKQAIFEARVALLEFAEGRAMSCEEICRMISDGDRRALRGRRVRAHLRECGACAAFAAAIPARRADLHAFAVPLAPLAAASVLARLTARGSAHAAAGGTSVGGAAGTVAGKLAGASLASKALVAAAVTAGAAVGVTDTFTQHHTPSRPAHFSVTPAAVNHTPVRAVAPGSNPDTQNHAQTAATGQATTHSTAHPSKSAAALAAAHGHRRAARAGVRNHTQLSAASAHPSSGAGQGAEHAGSAPVTRSNNPRQPPTRNPNLTRGRPSAPRGNVHSAGGHPSSSPGAGSSASSSTPRSSSHGQPATGSAGGGSSASSSKPTPTTGGRPVAGSPAGTGSAAVSNTPSPTNTAQSAAGSAAATSTGSPSNRSSDPGQPPVAGQQK